MYLRDQGENARVAGSPHLALTGDLAFYDTVYGFSDDRPDPTPESRDLGVEFVASLLAAHDVAIPTDVAWTCLPIAPDHLGEQAPFAVGGRGSDTGDGIADRL